MVTIQLTKFININSEGIKLNELYGYRIYNEGKMEYNNSFFSFKELVNDVNKETIIEFLRENHFDFYEMISIDNKFEFNGQIIKYK